jgi:small-conductance mechanosensitive channel
MKQWVVGRELRKRLTQAFKEHGIEMPRPTLHLYVEKTGEESGSTPNPLTRTPTPNSQ